MVNYNSIVAGTDKVNANMDYEQEDFSKAASGS